MVTEYVIVQGMVVKKPFESSYFYALRPQNGVIGLKITQNRNKNDKIMWPRAHKISVNRFKSHFGFNGQVKSSQLTFVAW